MDRHDFQIPVTFTHRVIFTRDAFGQGNTVVSELLKEGGGRRVLVFLEENLASLMPDFPESIRRYFASGDFEFFGVRILKGGEPCKADDLVVKRVWQEIDSAGIDRHSYVLVIGGGAFLDAVGFAAGSAHRGVRLVRFPTTTLSQDDSGVGVKNAINSFGKKNWIGSFSVPFAVINDFAFLSSQSRERSVAGLIEAVKVALVKDGEFFEWIERNASALRNLEPGVFEECIKRSALLHANHISGGGDAFENGSSRPLDFGHWAAHKLEGLTNYELPHAEAVVVGLALDSVYSCKKGFLRNVESERILKVLKMLGLETYHPGLDFVDKEGRRRVLAGLNEFREHLGGELTVLLLEDIGKGIDVHEFDLELLNASIEELRDGREALAD